MEGDIAPIEEKIYSETSQGGISGSAEIKKPGLLRFFTPRSALIAFGMLAIAIAGILLYRNTVLHEEISEFEFLAKESDAAGVAPTTSFLLTSSADLSTAVIKRHLVFDPPIEYGIKKIASSPSVFEVIPEAALRADTIYSIRIDEGSIASHPYGWAYQVKVPFQVISTLPRDRATSVPNNTGIEILFNREDLERYEESFSIEPAVEGRFEAHRKTLVFIPARPLLLETVYTVRVKASVRSKGSEDALAEEKVFRFETERIPFAESRPYFSFRKNLWEFRPDTKATFQAYADRLDGDGVFVRVYRLGSAEEFIQTYKDLSNKEFSWTAHNRFRKISLPDSAKVFEGKVAVEKQGWNSFLHLPEPLPEGFYVVSASYGEKKYTYAWVQMTPIASYSAMSGTKTLVWLKDITNGKNSEGAAVSFQGRELGKTNSDGALLFETPQELVRAPGDYYEWYSADAFGDYFFTASWGGRKTVIPVENDYGYASKVSGPDAWWDYFSVDKTVYLPSDTVRFWGIVRERAGADVRGEELTIELTNPYWERTSKDEINVYGETKAAVGDFYTITGSISFSNLRSGLYQLTVRRGEETIVSDHINIESYIKPAYRIFLSPDKEALFAGDSVSFRVRAEFFDGTPVPNLLLSYRGYFDNEYKGQVRLDARGEGSFAIATEYREYEYWPRYFGMSVRPAVAEEGQIDAYASVLVFGPRVELRVDEEIGKDTTKFTALLRNVSLDRARTKTPYWYSDAYLGDSAPDRNITVSVYEIIHRSFQTGTGYDPIQKLTYPIYSYSRDEVLRSSTELRTGADGKANFAFTPEKEHSYRIDFRAIDSGGRASTERRYVYGGEYSYYGYYAPGSVILKNANAKEAYRLGDQVSLLIQDSGGRTLPPGSGKYLFVKSANGIQSYQIADAAEFRDTFRESSIPNVQIMAVWFTGSRFEDSYPVNLSFDSDERRLSLVVGRDKDRYRPGENVSLNVRVVDREGKPRQAEVNVSGIDEAVFSLRPEERDVTNILYQDVFSSIVTRSSHFTPLESGAEKGCFIAGTFVLTPAGKKPIEDIRAGDEVITRGKGGVKDYVRARVSKTSAHFVAGYVLINESLGLTVNHRLLVNGEWKKAGSVEIGDELSGEDGSRVSVRSARKVDDWLLVYNIEVEEYRTFFANNVFVHNEEKGGGDARTDFRDVALYESKVTDENGTARFSFALPDAVTSWRFTLQAVTKDLFAGKQIEFLPVGLPFFVDAAINRTYLRGDEFVLRLRTFGSAKTSDTVSYIVESDALGKNGITLAGGDIIDIPLGKLPAGDHAVKITAQSGGNKDAIERTISVLESYFTETKTEWYELSPSLANIRGAQKGFTELLFASYERGRLYPLLQWLSCSCGMRVDQKIASRIARIYRARFYKDTIDSGGVDATRYQTPSGAISLLPYSDDDLELSAKFAHLLKDEETISLGRDSLVKYLRSALDDKKADIHRIAASLYGLSAFREPVLVSLERIKNERDLTTLDRAYIALALDALGAKEDARAYYRSLIKPKLTEKLPFIYLEDPRDTDEAILATTLLAGLAARLGEPEADGLFNYAMRNYPKRTLHALELLLYAKSALPAMKEGDVSFSYRAGSKNGSVVLKKAETFRIELSPEELAALTFEGIDGRVSLTTVFEEISDLARVRRDPTIAIERRYYDSAGRETREFGEGDLVKIILTPTFGNRALPGAYQIIDYVPSGLRPVTNAWHRPYGYGSESAAYPSDVEDQKVTFVAWNSDWWRRSITYYARVVSKGLYKAEPALIQSLESTDTKNISSEATIHIR